MGAHPYWYAVKYRPEIETALADLREREFRAGRYNPVMPFISFPITAQSPSPGPAHATIEDVFADADADGTRSILDVAALAKGPEFCAACPLQDDVLQKIYGTTQPTRAAVEAKMDFLEDVERGQAVYIILYDQGRPTEVMFAGYSFD